MLKKKGIVAALACALALGAWSGSTLATPVNVGGVVIDSDSPLDLNIQALNFRESSVGNVGDVLTGYGQIGSINGTAESTFCPGCNLNFTFEYTVSSIDTSGTSPRVVFDMGVLNFYVDHTQSFDVMNPDTAGMGTLWISMAGHAAPNVDFTTVGELYSTITGTIGNPTRGSSGFGLLDVTGGLAASFTDTNTLDDGVGGFADFSLDSSFQFQDAGICGSDGICYPITGTGGLLGSTRVAVPEPGAAGLLGVGLAFLGLLIGRRRKEAAGSV